MTEVKETSTREVKFAMFMWANMFAQAEGWGWFMKGRVAGKTKLIYNQMQLASTRLIKEIEKRFEDPEELEEFYESSEVFSRCLELIHKAKDEDKQELFLIMRDYVESKRSCNDIA